MAPAKELTKSDEPNLPEQVLPPSSFDEGGSFTPVSRKDRKTDKKQKTVVQQPAAATVVGKREHTVAHPPPPKDPEKPKELTQESSRKVFVEAPLPKVNPWQLNRSAVNVAVVEPQPSEKRVLKPQKQEAIVNGQAGPAVVQAPKDRRKYNQKV